MDEKPSNTAEPYTATELDAERAVTPPKDVAEDEYPSGVKVLIIMSAVWLSMFLVALVRTHSQLLKLSTTHTNDNNRIEQF
jgi:hypothetical protein